MSVTCTKWVWDHAPVTRSGELLVLLYMADCANHEGEGVWPSQRTLSTAARVSERQVRVYLRSLQEAGILTPIGKTPGGVVRWRINMVVPEPEAGSEVPGGTTLPGGSTLPVQGGSTLPTEPSVEPSVSSPDGEDTARAKAEPLGFADWLAHHARVSGHSIPAAGTQRRARLAAAWGSITADGFNPDDFIAASRAVTTEWHKERGHDSFETVLRKTEFGAKVARGRAEIAKDAARAPMREKYDGMDGAAAPVDPGVFD